MCQFVHLSVCLCVFLGVNIHVHLGQPKVEINNLRHHNFTKCFFQEEVVEAAPDEAAAADPVPETSRRREKVRIECVSVCLYMCCMSQ